MCVWVMCDGRDCGCIPNFVDRAVPDAAAKVARLFPEYALACSLRLCKACESGGARRDWDRGIRRQRRRRRRRKLLVLDTVV